MDITLSPSVMSEALWTKKACSENQLLIKGRYEKFKIEASFPLAAVCVRVLKLSYREEFKFCNLQRVNIWSFALHLAST